MSRKPVTILFAAAALSILIWAAAIARAQILNPGQTGLDPVTQRSLQELDRLMMMGAPDEIQEQLNKVINSSGYIRQLAQVYYKMAALNDANAQQAAASYAAVIQHWPDSAWAQKSLIDLVPLILISDGRLGQDIIPTVWSQQALLLSQAEDAPSLGEDPAMLQKETFLSVIYLAHQQANSSQLEALAAHELARDPEVEEVLTLARAAADIQAGRRTEARTRVEDWMTLHAESPLRPYASVQLYEASESPAARESAAQSLQDEFPESLEAALLRRDLSINQAQSTQPR